MNPYSQSRFSAPELEFCDDVGLATTHNIFDVSVPYPRSRSHSRPPTDDARAARRTNSVSGSSGGGGGGAPSHARAQAIVIPGASQHRMAASVGAAPHNWFFPPHSSPPSDFSLPTPDFSHDFFPFAIPGSHHKDLAAHSLLPASLPAHHHHHQQQQHPHHHHQHSHHQQQHPVVVQSPADKQAAIASEKRRRRRESHNAVERRRRDNINEKITELATLIPECMLDVGNSPNLEDQVLSPISPVDVVPGLKKEDDVPAASASEVGVVKANKGMILRKSVEYIRSAPSLFRLLSAYFLESYLQQLVTAQGARNRELEQQLRVYRGASSSPDPLTTTTNHVSGPTTLTVAENLVFKLPTTNEDEEMDQEPGNRGESEDSLSGASVLQEQQQAERGRTRSVRRPGPLGILTDVTMET